MNLTEYNQTVDLHADAVYRFILKHIKDMDKAKDVVQEAFTRLWEKSGEISAEKSKSYLFSTAYHFMIDVIRKDARMSYFEDQPHIDLSYEPAYSNAKEILDAALKLLPEEQRAVLLLRDYEGYSYEDIGHITKLSESQVKVYIYRARVFLKKYLVSIDNLV